MGAKILCRGRDANTGLQVGFLSEWQMYVQQIEGDSWKGNKFDKAKLDKMSGMTFNARLQCDGLHEHR
jgi:hypothetical protein